MFTLPELPYTYNMLEPYIDERTMQIHHDKHHGAYVKNLNDALAGQEKLLTISIAELMKNLAKVPDAVRTKVRNNGGGHYNHSLFWTVMAPPPVGGPEGAQRPPRGESATAINATFGSFEKFQELFSNTALSRFGSGWVWLSLDSEKLKIEDSPNQDNPMMEGRTPILGLDVWEHAYYLKYQNLRADYIKAWWNIINWMEVERRYKEAVQ